MSTNDDSVPANPPNDKTRELLMRRIKRARIEPGPLRDRYSDINTRWNSEDKKASVTVQELKKLWNDISPPPDDPAADL